MDKAKIRSRLTELLELPQGWDSYGASTIDPKAVDAASRLLDVLDHDPAVIPCNHGGVQLEWHRDGLELEVEISAAGEIIYD